MRDSLPITLIVSILLIGFNSFVILNPGQAGVISILGKARDGVLLEGIHFRPPLVSAVDIYDLTVQKFEVPAQSSTKDLQDLSARFAINFRLDPIQVVEIRRKQGTLASIVSKIIALNKFPGQNMRLISTSLADWSICPQNPRHL